MIAILLVALSLAPHTRDSQHLLSLHVYMFVNKWQQQPALLLPRHVDDNVWSRSTPGSPVLLRV
jgi:hypothetical protein